jgi:hypothetical protein
VYNGLFINYYYKIMPHTLEGTKLGEKDQAPKELFSKTASMSDTYGFSIKLSEDDLYEDRASRIPKGLVVTYSIYGDAPKLTVHREGEKDLIET